jgi:hypothetical protein
MDEQRMILVVEDDEATRAFLLENLAADGFRVARRRVRGRGSGRSRCGGPAWSCWNSRLRMAAVWTCSTASATPTGWLCGSTLTCRSSC